MKRILILLLIAISTGTISSVHAASYYSDPVGGSMDNDGSESSPWGSMRDVFEAQTPFNAGDVLFLMNGAHGQSYISEAHTNYVTIRAYPGHTPKVSTVLLDNGASYWAFDGITFTLDGTGGTTTRNYMLTMTDKASFIKIEDCAFYSAESSATWSKADWYTYAKDAIYLEGDHIVFNDNTIKNVYHALRIEGDYAEVRNNLIDNFGADAIRAVSSHAVYENNVIRDAYIQDYYQNHDDAIQLYDADNIAGGVVEDVVIRNNTIYSFADPITQDMIDDDLVGYSMQGIIVTDGHASNMVVENNLVIGDHYHGITLAGPVGCRVQNNTVIKTPTSANPDADALPWVQLGVSKRGIQPANSIIRNNIASKLTPWTYENGTDMQVDNNQEPEVAEYPGYFADYTNFNFRLRQGSPAIDAGTNATLTATDLAGLPRLVGPAVDCGAYEFQSTEDITPPRILRAADTFFSDEIVLVFSESITTTSAETPSHYSISGGVAVTSASLATDNITVTLGTTALSGGSGHTVVANGIEDYSGNAASNTTGSFSYLCNTNWASTYQDDEYGIHPPEDAFDGDLSTKWAAEGTEWIQKNFCQIQTIESIDIAFTWGNERRYSFIVEVSPDGRTFTQIFSGLSSGTSTGLEHFDVPDTPAKYIKITGFGNSYNDWNNYSEIIIHSTAIPFSYDTWLVGFPGIGNATNMTDNPDNDRLNNLAEWAMGGNPDNPDDIGHVPTVEIIEWQGDDWLEYIYAKRNDADSLGLNYHVERNTQLTNNAAWTINHDFLEGANDSAGPGFGTVTNWVITTVEDAQFMRLIIEAD